MWLTDWIGKALKKPKMPVGAVSIGYPGVSGYIKEPYTGAWQKNRALSTREGMLASSAVFACVDLISSDVAKLRLRSVQLTDGVWLETGNAQYSALLMRPNDYQTRVQFLKEWMASKLVWGNAYIYLLRNGAGSVIGMQVLNPRFVVPLVAPDGSVFYQVSMSPLRVTPMEMTVLPARDVIHDRCITSFHPLIGITPIMACAPAAVLASAIASDSADFFSNGAKPSGFLTAPGKISEETAKRLKETLEGYRSSNSGGVAVAGDGLKYDPMRMNGVDAQLIEQLTWTAQDVARCFHVPCHKIELDSGVKLASSASIYESMYYSDCLQLYLETIEQLLDDALDVPAGQGLRFDTAGLMRMDESARHAANAQAVGAGYMSPNEARALIGLPPCEGGDTPYLQQQNYSLKALAERDKLNPLAAQNSSGNTGNTNNNNAPPQPDDANDENANNG